MRIPAIVRPALPDNWSVDQLALIGICVLMWNRMEVHVDLYVHGALGMAGKSGHPAVEGLSLHAKIEVLVHEVRIRDLADGERSDILALLGRLRAAAAQRNVIAHSAHAFEEGWAPILITKRGKSISTDPFEPAALTKLAVEIRTVEVALNKAFDRLGWVQTESWEPGKWSPRRYSVAGR